MTDHAEVAVRLLGEAEKLGPEHATRNIAAAQVQATLALVEQQKRTEATIRRQLVGITTAMTVTMTPQQVAQFKVCLDLVLEP